MEQNPFAPPRAALAGAPADNEALILEGRKLPASRGAAWLREGWALLRLAPGAWVLLFVVFMLGMIVFAIIPGVSLLVSIAMPALIGGIMIGCRDLEEGLPPRVGTLIAGFKLNAGNLILAGLLEMAAGVIVSMVAMIPMFGMIFVLGPSMMEGVDPNNTAAILMAMLPMLLLSMGLVLLLSLPIWMAIWFTPALMVFHDLGPWVALKASFRGCLHNIWPLTLYSLLLLFWFLVALVPLGLGLLVVGPLLWTSMYTGYKDIFLRPAPSPA